ncbi:ApbE family protein [metagenome]|uniref:FAD:protein FMN transferase n=1 Tax=metagenome TaxID=256318 RepID=A0A2P2CI03_9ZZZZ
MTTATATARQVAHVMGMPVSLALRGRHATTAAGERSWLEAVATLRDVDRVFSTYRADSHVSRLDRGEIGLAECPPEVAEVLAIGELARVQSGGAFDVRRPDARGRLALDPSGVVKGWAVERAARSLLRLEDTDVCLSAGGDMVCHVADPHRDPWLVGIEDPHDPTRVVARVPVREGAVATSGAVHRGAHIVDARIGTTATGVAQVTVVGPDLTWADVDATAAYALGAGALAWLSSRPGRTGLVVWGDGRCETFGRAA